MTFSRRIFLSAGLASIALPAFANTEPRHIDKSVWLGRKLTSGEHINVQTAGAAIKSKLSGIDEIEFGMMDNHYRIRIPDHLLYEHDKDVMSKDGIRLATLMAEALVLADNVRVDLVTHHHSGEHSYATANMTKSRAATLRATLMSRQVRGDLLKATGLGDRFPIASNADFEGRARNRRVELLIRPAYPKNPAGME